MSLLGSKDDRILAPLKSAVGFKQQFHEFELTAEGQEHMKMTFSYEDN